MKLSISCVSGLCNVPLQMPDPSHSTYIPSPYLDRLSHYSRIRCPALVVPLPDLENWHIGGDYVYRSGKMLSAWDWRLGIAELRIGNKFGISLIMVEHLSISFECIPEKGGIPRQEAFVKFSTNPLRSSSVGDQALHLPLCLPFRSRL
jgi:hypothetical protein